MKPESISATDAKNDFARVLDRVRQGRRVVITKHDAPRAVMLSMDDYEALTAQAGHALATLSKEFDDLVARMQTPHARAGINAAFAASPAQLGRAAVAAARRRG